MQSNLFTISHFHANILHLDLKGKPTKEHPYGAPYEDIQREAWKIGRMFNLNEVRVYTEKSGLRFEISKDFIAPAKDNFLLGL